MKLPFQWRYILATSDPQYRPYPPESATSAVMADANISRAHTLTIEVAYGHNPIPSAWQVPRAHEMDAIFQDLYDRYGPPSGWINFFGEIAVRGLQEVHRSVMMQDSMLRSGGFRETLDWSNPLLGPSPMLSRDQLNALREHREKARRADEERRNRDRSVTISGEAIRYEASKHPAERFRSGQLQVDEILAAQAVAERFLLRYPNTPYSVSSTPDRDGRRLTWIARAADDDSKVVEIKAKGAE